MPVQLPPSLPQSYVIASGKPNTLTTLPLSFDTTLRLWRFSVNVVVTVWLAPLGMNLHVEVLDVQAPLKAATCEPTAGVPVRVMRLPSFAMVTTVRGR